MRRNLITHCASSSYDNGTWEDWPRISIKVIFSYQQLVFLCLSVQPEAKLRMLPEVSQCKFPFHMEKKKKNIPSGTEQNARRTPRELLPWQHHHHGSCSAPRPTLPEQDGKEGMFTHSGMKLQIYSTGCWLHSRKCSLILKHTRHTILIVNDLLNRQLQIIIIIIIIIVIKCHNHCPSNHTQKSLSEKQKFHFVKRSQKPCWTAIMKRIIL